MRFGKAEEKDLQELVRLRLAYLEEDFGSLSDEQRGQVEETLPDYLRRRLNRELLVYTAREEEICACVWLLAVEKPASPAFPSGRTGFVMNVYTAPHCRRQGVATRLLRMMLEEAREMGMDVVELKATDAGYPVYRKIGFTDTPMSHRPMTYRWEKEK